MSCSRAQRTRRIGRRRRINVTHLSIRIFCDIRECYLFLDSRFFATYGNVTYFSIRVFLRHAGMLSFIVVSSCLHCCCRVSHFLFECYCFRFPVGGGGDAPLNGPAGQRGVRTGASSESSAAAAGKSLAHYRPWAPELEKHDCVGNPYQQKRNPLPTNMQDCCKHSKKDLPVECFRTLPNIPSFSKPGL